MSVQPNFQQVSMNSYTYVQNSSHIVEENNMTGGESMRQEWNANQRRVIERLLLEEKIVRLFYYAVRDEDHFIAQQADESNLTFEEIIGVYCELVEEDPEYYFEVMPLPYSYFDGRKFDETVVFDRR